MEANNPLEAGPLSGLRPPQTYRVFLAQGDLNFRALDLTDPVPLGRQILQRAGLDPRGSYSLFAILASGDFEDIRLDETFDLRERGVERFVVFQTDRNYLLTMNDHQLQWGKPVISGSALYSLGEVRADEAVFLEVRGGEDRLVEPSDLFDLAQPEVERFISAPRPTPTFEIVINARPYTVNHRRVTFEEVVALAFPGPHEPNIIFSMTYRHAASEPHRGELGAGGAVEVKKEGTTFNVTPTDKS